MARIGLEHALLDLRVLVEAHCEACVHHRVEMVLHCGATEVALDIGLVLGRGPDSHLQVLTHLN